MFGKGISIFILVLMVVFCWLDSQYKLINPSEERFQHLVTQLNWRLQEGQGEAIYEIGVSGNRDEHELPVEVRAQQA
jgi:GTPase